MALVRLANRGPVTGQESEAVVCVDREPPSAVVDERDQRAANLSLLLVGLAVAWNLWSLAPETSPVAYADDSSVHEQMVRAASRLLGSGRLPLRSWFPYLGLGSPHFLHYQSLPAMLTGALGLAVGPDVAFRWTLYLLLSLWPVSVYLGCRLFGLRQWAAGIAAAAAPFLVSAYGVGYEDSAYLWIGYGVWAQLWASWTLPLAWGATWRAICRGKGRSWAAFLIALTMALHFETGYLALLPVVPWALVAGRRRRARLARAGVVIVGGLLIGAWVIVPLLDQRPWAATNEVLQGTSLVNGYGAATVLRWLVTGQLVDHGRLPIVTLLSAVGLGRCMMRSGANTTARALLVALVTCLCLAFGRTSFGSLVGLIPGSTDIFFRRFLMGVQLVMLMLAGVGGCALGAAGRAAVLRLLCRHTGAHFTSLGAVGAGALACLLVACLLAPAWLQQRAYADVNARAIAVQRVADATQGAELQRLVGVVNRDRGGRVYAGMPSNWGTRFRVGAVPVFKYLEALDVDEVGYTLRTASLMSVPEYLFAEDVPGDYRLFGIRYLILPTGRRPPVPAVLVMRSGPYALWRVASGGYLHIGRVVGTMNADRSDVGLQSIDLMHSGLAADAEYLAVNFGHTGVSPPAPVPRHRASAGDIQQTSVDMATAEVRARVRVRASGDLVLSASYDPGWQARVDGRNRVPRMVAPALPAVALAPGEHTVQLRYVGYRGYLPLCLLAILAIGVLIACDLCAARHRYDARTVDGLGRASRSVGMRENSFREDPWLEHRDARADEKTPPRASTWQAAGVGGRVDWAPSAAWLARVLCAAVGVLCGLAIWFAAVRPSSPRSHPAARPAVTGAVRAVAHPRVVEPQAGLQSSYGGGAGTP